MAEFTESQYYHALALAFRGEYRELETAFRDAGSWAAAWGRVEGKGGMRDPAEAWGELERNGITFILASDPSFPALLREIPFPPFGLYIRGALPSTDPIVAIVGTRKASQLGLRAASMFAERFAVRGIPVVSGLAFGIDAAAHEGALAARGATVAVLANGLDTVYPRSHMKLAEHIVASGGALLSEYPPGSPTLPRRFLERNRIVSGLARGVVVIEAPQASGALATARFALEQNREVFVVPGPASHPNYAGSHALVKAGAALVTEPQDVFDAFGIGGADIAASDASSSLSGSGAVSVLLTVLRREGRSLDVDTLAARAALSAAETQAELTDLIMRGCVEERGGRYLAR